MHNIFKSFLNSLLLLLMFGVSGSAWATYSLEFDGVDDHISANTLVPSFDSSSFTLSAWIKTSVSDASTSGNNFDQIVNWIISPNLPTVNNAQFRIVDSKLEFGMNTGTWESVTSTNKVNTGSWVHVAVVKDGNAVQLYINGSPDGTGTISQTLTPTEFYIGAYTESGSFYSSSYFNGKIDEIALYDAALSSSNVSSIYNSGVPAAFWTNQILYFRMDNNGGIGTTLSDVSVNSYDGTLVNGTTWSTDIPGDSTGPTMTITSAEVADGATSNDSTLALTFTSNEATSDFAESDITMSGGSLSSFNATSSTVYTATFTPTSDGATTVDVTGSTFTDGSGNNNTAATQFNWAYDSTAPTITSVTADWGASLNQLEDDSNGTVTVDTSGAEDGQTVTLTLSSVNYTGTVSSSSTSISVAASALQALSDNTSYTLTTNVSDAAGNAATAHTSSSFTALNNPGANNALTFDGVDDYVDLPDLAVSSSNTVTIEAWVKDTGNDDWAGIVFNRNPAGGGAQALGLSVRTDGSVRYTWNHSTSANHSSYNQVTGVVLTDSVWTHLALTIDGNTAKIYKNGVLSYTSSGMTHTAFDWSSDFAIGRDTFGASRSFAGDIDEVRIWNDVRTASEISNNMTSELNGNETGLVAYYKFNEPDTGTILSNATTGDLDGTLTNMTGTEWTASSAFSTDITAPTASLAYTIGGNAVTSVKSGDTVRITASFNEAMADSPVMQISGSGVTALSAANMTKNSTTSFYYDWAVGSGDGTQTFALATGTDSAGNVITASPTSGATLTVDNTAPVITSNSGGATASISIAENTTAVTTVVATDTNALTYTISGGADQAKLGISSGVLTFSTAPDYESPTDTGSDNTYVVEVTATDAAGNTDVQTITVTVTDIDENRPAVAFSPLNGATAVAVGANITLTFDEAVRLLDDTALTDTNVDALLTLKATNASGADIAFDATINSGKTIITINPTSDFSPSQVVYVAIGATVEDSTDNALVAANATFTVAAFADSVPPTMVIAAAEVTDGGTSDNATLALTFTSSEATTNFAAGDITVANASLSNFSATSSTVYTATLTPTVEGAVAVDVAAGTFTDAASNNNTAATQFNWTYLADPTAKVDVVGSIKASNEIASQWTHSTFSAISNRLGWLERHKGQSRTSYQGIQFQFTDAALNTLMATPSASFTDTNWTNKAVSLATISNDSLVRLAENIEADATKAAINEAAIIRQNATGTLNPAFKPIFNGWSIWTDGTVTIGDIDAASSSAKQSSRDYAISIGVDKPISDERLVGLVLRTGQGSVDVGTSTSKIKSESYSLSGYSTYEGYKNLVMEGVAGVGIVKYNLSRADGVHTLNGARDANQAFASFSASKPATVFGKLSLSPYVKTTYNHTSFGAYSESGGITALSYKKYSVNETQVALGTDLRYQLFIGNNDIYPYARIAYSLDVSDQANAPAHMYYNSNPSKLYSLAIDTRSRATVKFAMGADLITMGGINASLGYQRNTVVHSGHYQSVSLRLGQAF